MQEVMARHGKVLLISDAAGVEAAGTGTWKTLTLPQVAAPWAPILYAIPAQLAGLSHRHRQGHRCGPAAQPGEIGDGRMTAITLAEALAALEALADPARAAEMAAYHQDHPPGSGPSGAAHRPNWPPTGATGCTVEARVALADGLWQTDIHDARVAAAKLLTQARLRPDEAAWALIASWVPQFDGWALADHACDAGNRRLLADPSRIETVAGWTTSDHMWTPPRRAGDHAALGRG